MEQEKRDVDDLFLWKEDHDALPSGGWLPLPGAYYVKWDGWYVSSTQLHQMATGVGVEASGVAWIICPHLIDVLPADLAVIARRSRDELLLTLARSGRRRSPTVGGAVKSPAQDRVVSARVREWRMEDLDDPIPILRNSADADDPDRRFAAASVMWSSYELGYGPVITRRNLLRYEPQQLALLLVEFPHLRAELPSEVAAAVDGVSTEWIQTETRRRKKARRKYEKKAAKERKAALSVRLVGGGVYVADRPGMVVNIEVLGGFLNVRVGEKEIQGKPCEPDGTPIPYGVPVRALASSQALQQLPIDMESEGSENHQVLSGLSEKDDPPVFFLLAYVGHQRWPTGDDWDDELPPPRRVGTLRPRWETVEDRGTIYAVAAEWITHGPVQKGEPEGAD